MSDSSQINNSDLIGSDNYNNQTEIQNTPNQIENGSDGNSRGFGVYDDSQDNINIYQDKYFCSAFSEDYFYNENMNNMKIDKNLTHNEDPKKDYF